MQSSNGLFRYYQKEILIRRKIHAPIGASGGAVDPKTHHNWVWAFIDAIAERVDEVVSNHSVIMPPAETHPYSHPSTCTRTRVSPWAGRSSTGYSRIQRTGTPSASTCPPNAGCTRRKGGMIVPYMTCPPTAAIPYPATRSQYWPTGTVGSSSCRSRNL